MRAYFIATMAGALAFATLMLTGCANQNQTPTKTTEGANPAKKTYTQHDLDRTGQTTTGAALESADPDIQKTRQ